MSLNKQIVFAKWENPLSLPPKRTENEGWKDSYQKRENGVPCAFSPNIGIIPLSDSNDIGKIFNFWMMYVNFDITPAVAKAVAETEGVEIFEVQTRYRARIGIAKTFRPRDIFGLIQSRLGLLPDRKARAVAKRILQDNGIIKKDIDE